jgi:DmsE family decaheme c-type cytochrome
MKTHRWTTVISAHIAWAFALYLLAAPVSVFGADSRATGNKEPSGPIPAIAEYAGVDACKACHEDLYKNFESSAHFKTTRNGGHGCESCHGPGADHVAGGGDVDKIVRFQKLTRAKANTRCLSCHGQKHEQRHFQNSSHASNDVGCLDCHSPHHAAQPEFLLARRQSDLCFGCHTSTKAEFAKPFHHRVGEGLVECSDCHNVHGTTGLRQVKTSASGDAACVKCHADKQGPFVYEHVPVKTEGCTSCHSPHGSTNARFLKVSQVNLMCLQCHTYPVQGPIGPAHNESAKYQACTMCHTAIHGSNASNVFFR